MTVNLRSIMHNDPQFVHSEAIYRLIDELLDLQAANRLWDLEYRSQKIRGLYTVESSDFPALFCIVQVPVLWTDYEIETFKSKLRNFIVTNYDKITVVYMEPCAILPVTAMRLGFKLEA